MDDIVVSGSVDSSCPPERECSFHGSLCGLLPQPSADFHWNRITGASQPGNSSGPTADHTLGTEQGLLQDQKPSADSNVRAFSPLRHSALSAGYYLSAELWRYPEGSRGAMMTAVMEPTPPDGECLTFWYYMEGADVGELSVLLQPADSHGNASRLWTKRGDQGRHWRHGRVTLLRPDTQFQVNRGGATVFKEELFCFVNACFSSLHKEHNQNMFLPKLLSIYHQIIFSRQSFPVGLL